MIKYLELNTELSCCFLHRGRRSWRNRSACFLKPITTFWVTHAGELTCKWSSEERVIDIWHCIANGEALGHGTRMKLPGSCLFPSSVNRKHVLVSSGSCLRSSSTPRWIRWVWRTWPRWWGWTCSSHRWRTHSAWWRVRMRTSAACARLRPSDWCLFLSSAH